jgi:hypothetical protein
MIGSITRGVVAVVLGFLVAAFFIVAVEGVCAVLYPFPDGVDPTDIEVCKAHVAQLPASAFLIGVVGWGLAAFTSSWAATRLGANRHPAHGIGLGLLLLAAAVLNMLMLPYPAWFWVAVLIALPVCFLLGARLGRGRSLDQRGTLNSEG